MQIKKSYSVAIRTLGTAGKKFEREIASLLKQSLPPDAIYAYIPYGYKIPVFPDSDKIVWVRCEKGMITQRARPYDEIGSDYILFLDDDVELSVNLVERLFDGLTSYNADAIAADVFANHKAGFTKRVMALLYGTGFFFSRKWGLKIRRSGHFSYNFNPPEKVMLSQTGAGPCSLISKKAYKSIDFIDERWMESFGYCLGEDQMFFNKLHVNGYKLLIHYDVGITNLDAATGGRNNYRQNLRTTPILRYAIWHRTQYATARTFFAKMSAVLSYATMQLPVFLGDVIFVLRDKDFHRVQCHIKGIIDGIKYTRSKEYKAIPPYKR